MSFLKAEWRKLAMANYAIDKDILKKYVPAKTELDLWNDTCYVSLIGFMFLNTKVLGLKIPFHINFEEVHLRFYVNYKDGIEWKRNVLFFQNFNRQMRRTFCIVIKTMRSLLKISVFCLINIHEFLRIAVSNRKP